MTLFEETAVEEEEVAEEIDDRLWITVLTVTRLDIAEELDVSGNVALGFGGSTR